MTLTPSRGARTDCLKCCIKPLAWSFLHPGAPHCPLFTPSLRSGLAVSPGPLFKSQWGSVIALFIPALKVCTLLSRDSKASEVEDLELFMPEGVPGRGRVRSGPWLPALATGLQGLVALRMMSFGNFFSVGG